MHLNGLDLFLWAAGFIANSALLVVLWYRRRAKRFPLFTALITLNVVRTVVLYLALNHTTREEYFYGFWLAALLDMTLQLSVVYELASGVFRPLGVWAHDVRSTFIWVICLSVVIALLLSWLAVPVGKTWIQVVATKGSLLSATLMSELFVAMMALSIRAGYPWKTHASKIAQGLGAYSLICVSIETGHSYFGRQELASAVLSYVRMVVYLSCVVYWIRLLWQDEQPPQMLTEEMRLRLCSLQQGIEYGLQELRSRNRW
jgi:hypothetical protein